MKCKCGNRAGWWENLCKECELKERIKWKKEHTFKLGEIVKIVFNKDEDFGVGKVINRIEDNDDYSAGDYYKVKLENGSIEIYGNWLLKKEVLNDKN